DCATLDVELPALERGLGVAGAGEVAGGLAEPGPDADGEEHREAEGERLPERPAAAEGPKEPNHPVCRRGRRRHEALERSAERRPPGRVRTACGHRPAPDVVR